MLGARLDFLRKIEDLSGPESYSERRDGGMRPSKPELDEVLRVGRNGNWEQPSIAAID